MTDYECKYGNKFPCNPHCYDVGCATPKKEEWKCFHCGEVFTEKKDASIHFGIDMFSTPGCIQKVSPGGEQSLLQALREAENELAKYRREDIETMQALYRLQSRHSDALRRAEEAGYERGLRDAGLHEGGSK